MFVANRSYPRGNGGTLYCWSYHLREKKMLPLTLYHKFLGPKYPNGRDFGKHNEKGENGEKKMLPLPQNPESQHPNGRDYAKHY